MRKVLITILLIIEIFMINLTYQSFLHKEITKEENKITKRQFAMFIQDNDEYVEYEGDNLFPKGYYVNKSLSKCVDEKGNPIEDAISSLGNNVTITSNKTIYCTLYFDKNEILEYLRSKDTNGVLSEDIVGDMYRYQGVAEEYASDDLKIVNDNYICLGKDCSEYGEDLYRIIGVTDTGELKVIKKTTLSNLYQWHSYQTTNTIWPDSDLFHRLNDYEEGTYKDDSFYSTMDEKLRKLVIKRSWMYGDTNDTSDNLYNGDLMYAIENGLRETSHRVKNSEDDNFTIQRYTWNKDNDKVNAYIGLQYIHDYIYAYPGGNPQSDSNAKKSWIHFYNNDNTSLGPAEWLIPRFGYASLGRYDSRRIDLEGDVDYYLLDYKYMIRPVFYLTSDLSLIGEGTLTEPFEIDYEKNGVDIINSKPTSLSTEEVGGMHRFQGTKDEVNNNYICLGEDCSEYGEDLYRIIGITADGRLKVIKKTNIGAYQWDKDINTDIKWPNSLIFQALNTNENSFYNNFNAKYKKYIEKIKWMYGDSS